MSWPFLTRGVEVCVDRDDGAGYVASNLDSDHGVQRAGGANGANYSSACDFGDYVFRRFRAAADQIQYRRD